MTQHTPTPWKNLQNGKDEWFVMGHPNKTVICNQCVSKEDAAFIVRAVNCHEELLASCKEMLEWWRIERKIHGEPEKSLEKRAAQAIKKASAQ